MLMVSSVISKGGPLGFKKSCSCTRKKGPAVLATVIVRAVILLEKANLALETLRTA